MSLHTSYSVFAKQEKYTNTTKIWNIKNYQMLISQEIQNLIKQQEFCGMYIQCSLSKMPSSCWCNVHMSYDLCQIK